MATFVLKAHLCKPNGSVETRRFPLLHEITSSPGLFEIVFEKIRNTFADLQSKSFRLMWKDSDGDFVLMSTDEEIQDAMSTLGNSSLQVYIQVDGDKEETKTPEVSADPMEESETPKGNENERQSSDECEYQGYPDVDTDFGMMGPPLPPPPPPPPMFPFGFGPFMCKGKGKGRFGKHHHRGPMGPGQCGNKHHGPMGVGPFGKHHPRGPMGPHGGLMGTHGGPMGLGPFGKHHPRGPMGPPGGLMGPHGGPMGPGPFGKHHWGGPMGLGPFGNHPHGGPMGPGLFVGAMGPHIGPFGKHHSHHHHHGWKAGLRSAVPLLHRQWTKLFIQKWREGNIANATTTTSENESDNELTMEEAGVPEAYKKWLLLLLPKWHKRWGAYKLNSKEKDDDSRKEERKLIKTSVPREFRKWVKWYLQRNFGQRMRPRFQGQDWSPFQEEGLFVRPGCVKRRMLASMVPASHRLFAKKFIHDWRVERKLDGTSQAVSTTSESEDENAGLEKAEPSAPKAYGQWLGIFLPRWHRWRGLIEENDMPKEKGGVGQFRDTVPMDFRAWVKHYLCRQYGRQRPAQIPGQGDEDVTMKKYQTWLKLFQKQWAQEQKAMGEDSEDITVMTSGDEAGPSDDNGDIPDTTLKRLRLSDEEDETPQKSVHFDPASLQQPVEQNKLQRQMMEEMTRSMMESEEGADEMATEIRGGRRKHPINHSFRKWAWKELDNWNGNGMNDISTESQTSSEATDDTAIPPHVYQWMSKVMMKLQMKKMKQEMKAAKRAMKATQKQAKAERKFAKQAAKFGE